MSRFSISSVGLLGLLPRIDWDTMNSKQWALFCSVVLLGMSNLSSKGTPPSADRAVEIAQKFENFLEGQEQPNGMEKHPRL